MYAEPPVQRERLAYMKEMAATPITCTVEADCAEKWSRTLQWIGRHSVYSIRGNTNNEIVTNRPIEPATDSAFTITKSLQDANSYVILFSSTCGKTQFCVPSSLELHSEFNNFVLHGIRDGNF